MSIFSSGELTDVSGAGSFDLLDSAVLSGTVPKKQTVTADAIESHNALVKISGTVTNEGTLVLDSPSKGGEPAFVGTTSQIDNDGLLIAESGSSNQTYLQTNLTNAAGGTVEIKSGELNQDENTTTTNEGKFEVASGATFAATSSSDLFVNKGSLANGGTVSLSGNASWTQEAGTKPQSGGPVSILNSGKLTDVSGAGSFDLIDSAVLSGTVPKEQTVTADAIPSHDAEVKISGTVTNEGTLAMESPAGGGEAILAGTSSHIDNKGLLNAEAKSANENYLETNLTNEASGTVQVESGELNQNENTTTTNEGAFKVEAGATFAASSSKDEFVNRGSLENKGTISLSGDASWTQEAGAAAETGNAVSIFSSGELTDVSGAGSFDLLDSAVLSGTVPKKQTVTADAIESHNALVKISGTVTNEGTLVLDSPSKGGEPAFVGTTSQIDNDGLLIAESGSSNQTYLQTNLTNAAGGTVEIKSGELNQDENTTTTNEGDFKVAAGASFAETSSKDQFVNAGRLEPEIESATSLGTVKVSGGAAFDPGGLLFPDLVNGYEPAVGTEFDVITSSASISGEFAMVGNDFEGDYSKADIIAVRRNAALTKPEVTVQPKDDTVTAPEAASFTAEASGNPTPTVQWEVSEAGGPFKEIAGAKSDTYTILATNTSESGNRYEAVFTNSQGKATSDPATLTVNAPACAAAPAITEEPKDQTVTAPATASFKAAASTPANCAAPSVQWYSEAPGAPVFSPILGAESDTYTTPPTATTESGTKFEAIFSNAKGETTTEEVTLTVNAPACAAAPAITEEPKDQTVTAPATASFKAAASTPANCAAPSVQWYSEAPGAPVFSPILGAESDTYTTPPTATTESGTKFEAIFSNAKGETTTEEVTLTVNAPACAAAPAITEEPKDQTVTAPATASFKAAASTPANCAAPSVQWYSEAPGAPVFSPILGAESDTYTTPPTATTESGTKFEAIFSNAKGETTTEEVTLTVNAPACAAAPAITEEPKDQTVTAPATASFKAAASTPANCAAPSVQWYSEAPGAPVFSPILGAESDTYTTPPTATTESGTKFEAIFSNAKGETTTEEVTLTVNAPACAAAPAITEEPKDQTVTAPATASFKAAASTPANCAAPSVQWYSEAPGAPVFSPILGAESDTYTTPPTATTESGTKFEAIFSNAKGETTTEEVTLTVNAPACAAAPAITEEPKDQTVTAPATASFKAAASTPANCAAPSVQWYSEAPGAPVFSPILGAESDTYTTPPTATTESGTKFEAIFSNAKGETTTEEVTLTVNAPACAAAPAITEEPKDQTVTAPATASFKAAASTPANCAAPSVQWYSEAPGAPVFSPILGAESDTYTTPPTATTESGTKFEAIFSNAKGETTTEEVTLTVNAPACAAAPAITEEPKDQTVTAPATASFKAAASTPANCAAPSVQWYSEAPGAPVFSPILGAESDTYTTPPTATTESGTKFEAIFSNAKGETTTEEVTLTVNAPACAAAPAITEEPKDQTVTAPATASFKAAASTPANCAAPSVQWYSEAPGAPVFSPILGAESDTYTTPPTATTESGTKFEAIFSNAKGETTTEEVTLTVNPALANPEVTEQPKDETVTAPATASFTAEASGNPAPSVQWQVSEGGGTFKEIAGATSDTYTIPTTSATESGDRYEAVFKNSQGEATSSIATLTVNPALAKPEVTVQPKDDTVTAPAAASFTAEASGNPAPSVQWQVSEGGGTFKEIAGATSDTYTIPTTSATESGDRYEAVFKNSQGEATSSIATLTVNPALAKPEVTVQPKDDTVTAPAAASFTAEASGNPAPSVQWQVSEGGGTFKEIAGATSDTYTIPTTSATESGDRYEAVFKNSQGEATSSIATLTVNPALAKPEVTVQPKDDTVTAPAAASFTAEASGNPAPSVQWQVSEGGGTFKEIAGATSDTYTIPTTSATESGDRYEAVFKNSQGEATSSIATLTVNPALAKPEVTVQPKDDTVTAPAAASFTAEASGNPAPSVQWQVSEGGGTFKEIAGATSDTYTIPTTSATESGDRYEAVFKNSQGEATSSIATLTVNPALAKPEVTVQPKDDTVTAPAAASFTAEASGNPAPSVQWQVSEGGGTFKEIAGATSDTYTIPTTSATESGDRYEAVFKNSQGEATSSIATLTVNPALAKPEVTVQPKDDTVTAPAAASFTAEASGNPAPSVQWQVSEGGGTFKEIAGATSDTYTIPTTSTTESGDRYEAVFKNSQGEATSSIATLTVNPALAKPEVTVQPKDDTVTAPAAASFTAEASGNPAPSVQWQVSEGGGTFKEIAGATSDTYTIPTTSATESGDRYEAVFKNSQGEATSSIATLTVEPPAPVVEAITPNEGPATGSTPVKISGKGFLKGATVTIGSAATSVVVASEEEITALTPSGSGAREVIVSDEGGSSTLGPSFTYVTVAPTVEAKPASALTQTSATLNGTVNPEDGEVSECQFEYGTSTAYGKTAPCTPSPGSGSTPAAVSAAITGLTANTTYHFRISATNTGGTSKGSDETFKTLPNPPTVEAKPASLLTQTSATLNGAVNPEGAEVSKCEVEYGTSTAYGKTAPCTPSPGSGSTPAAVSAAITGLTANTTYHFRISATNAGGASESTDETFKTPPIAPEVVTKAASSVTQTTATVGATVNPNGGEVTACTFEYGTSTAYGKTAPCTPSPGSGSTPAAVSAAITGLTANTTYHFRISATNTGGTSKGSDETLATLPNTPAVEPSAPTSLTQTSAVLNGTVNPEGGEISKCEVEYGASIEYGSSVPCAIPPGSASGAVSVSASLTGLTANTTYHFRISVTTAGGTTKGADATFKTLAIPTATATSTTSGGSGEGGSTAKSGVLGSVAAAPPPPKFGVSGNVSPVSGSVLVKLPGSSIFVALTGLREIPFGTVINATNGSVTVKTVGPHGVIQTIVYSQGEFKLTQEHDGFVAATLVGGDFAVCPTAAERSHLARTSSKRASPKHVVRKLWSEGHGKYSTKGSYAAGAVLGTRWLTEDLCDGTFIHVVTDRVAVTNFVNHRHLTVKAGHSYLAKAP